MNTISASHPRLEDGVITLGRPCVVQPRFRVGVDPGRLRVALTTSAPNDGDVDDACVTAAREAAELLVSLGHDVEEAAPDWGGAELMTYFKPVWQSRVAIPSGIPPCSVR